MSAACKTWIQTFPSHQAFDLLNPRAEDVRAVDVAHHLGNLCRYTGGARQHYSVAEHCVRVSEAVEAAMRAARAADTGACSYTDAEIRAAALAGLVHDAAEAYTGDASQPMKVALRQLAWENDLQLCEVADETRPKDYMSPFDCIEDDVQTAVAERFGVELPWPAIVSHFDLVLLVTEKRDLLGPEPKPWAVPDEIKPLEGQIEPWPAWEASERWLVRLVALGGSL